MRALIILTMLTVSLNVQAKITNSDLDKVLVTINNVCGDTWCEGDYDYSFERIECFNNDTCKLSFYTIDTEERRSKLKTCKLTGIKSTKDMMVGRELSTKFYEQLDQCLSDIKE